jgi:DNA primase catalytic subunit
VKFTPEELLDFIERGYPDQHCESCGQLVCQKCGYCANLDCKDCMCIELRRSFGFPDWDGNEATFEAELAQWERFLKQRREENG